jgi:hypothetical protein
MQGQQRKITIGADTLAAPERKFAVYAGDGVWLRSLARTPDGRSSFGRDRARRYTRAAAIAALHAVRRAGRSAWIVPHPGEVRSQSEVGW